MVAKNMMFDELGGAKGATQGPQMDNFRCQKASKNTPRNYLKIDIKKTQVLMPRSYQNDANIGATYSKNYANKLQRNMSRKL